MTNERTGEMMGARGDVGETLIEILLTVVIVGLTFTALFSALAGAGNAGNVQRTSAQTDIVMRNFAEATKAGAQRCFVGGDYTVKYTENKSPEAALPKEFELSVAGAGVVTVTRTGDDAGFGSACPPVNAPQLLTLKVTPPFGSFVTMQIKVNTP